MNKGVLVGLTILAVSTSAASAWTHRPLHSRATNPNAYAAATYPGPYAGPRGPYAGPRNAYASMGAPPAAMGGMSKNQEMYMKNLHDSGYNPKNDFTPSGTMRQQ